MNLVLNCLKKTKQTKKPTADSQLRSSVLEQPQPRIVSGNLPSQSLDPGILNMMNEWREQRDNRIGDIRDKHLNPMRAERQTERIKEVLI